MFDEGLQGQYVDVQRHETVGPCGITSMRTSRTGSCSTIFRQSSAVIRRLACRQIWFRLHVCFASFVLIAHFQKSMWYWSWRI